MAVQFGYQLSSEEHRPNDLVRYAQMAEEHGFAFATISDHFHPWIDAQGQSPFVWSVIGGIAHATERLGLGTWVTCPTTRIHPALVAQAAATSEVRQARLEEALGVIRLLWRGGNQSHHGRYFTVENARLYTLPGQAPPLLVAGGGPRGAELAGRLGDGLIATGPEADLVRAFDAAGGRRKPRYGSVTVCWARDETSARTTAHRLWPTAAMESSLSWELPLPQHFEDAAKLVTEDAVAEEIICGPDPERYVAAIKKYVEAGFDHVVIHQVGPDQAGFFAFYAKELQPALKSLKPKVASAKDGARKPRRQAA